MQAVKNFVAFLQAPGSFTLKRHSSDEPSTPSSPKSNNTMAPSPALQRIGNLNEHFHSKGSMEDQSGSNEDTINQAGTTTQSVTQERKPLTSTTNSNLIGPALPSKQKQAGAWQQFARTQPRKEAEELAKHFREKEQLNISPATSPADAKSTVGAVNTRKTSSSSVNPPPLKSPDTQLYLGRPNPTTQGHPDWVIEQARLTREKMKADAQAAAAAAARKHDWQSQTPDDEDEEVVFKGRSKQ